MFPFPPLSNGVLFLPPPSGDPVSLVALIGFVVFLLFPILGDTIQGLPFFYAVNRDVSMDPDSDSPFRRT